MRQHTFLVIACMVVSTVTHAVEVTPIRPEALYKAAERAREENRFLYIAFLGDGWSVSCKKFKSKVLETPEFKKFADRNLIYLPVEARRKPKLTSRETATLQSWVIHFDVKVYPTVILLAPDGQELLRHGYRETGAAEYVSLLQAVLPE